MLSLDKIAVIKHKYENEGLSAGKIAEELGYDSRTIKKYLEQDDWRESPHGKRVREKSVLGEYISVIDEWLETDMKAPRKQRHTAKRIYDRLCTEKSYKGAESTVRKYVREKKERLYKSRKEGCLPLNHLPGYAQVDFGDAYYLDASGRERLGAELVVSFPYSNGGWSQLLPGQNQECLFVGLQNIFIHIGGVPIGIKFDNMSTAVSQILDGGKRNVTEGFLRFQMHFRFQSKFCNPGKGNEKGNVENKVGYLRRNMLVPLPKVNNLEEFNKKLLILCDDDQKRKHYRNKMSISKIWREDAAVLLNMPEYEYDCFRYEASLRVSSTGFVTIDAKDYGLSPEYAGRKVQAKVRYTTVELYVNDKLIVTHERIYGEETEKSDWRVYIDTWIKKPGGLEYTRYFDKMPQYWREYLLTVNGKQRKTALALLKEIVGSGNEELANDVIELAREQGRTDVDSLRQCYRLISEEEVWPPEMIMKDAIPRISFEPDLGSYDSLTGGSEK